MSISSAQSGQVWSPSSLMVVLMDEKTPGPEQIRLVLHTIIKLSYQKPQIFDRTRNTSEIEVSLNIAQFLINQSSNLNISTDTRNTSGVGRGVKNPILALNFSTSTILPISPSWTRTRSATLFEIRSSIQQRKREFGTEERKDCMPALILHVVIHLPIWFRLQSRPAARQREGRSPGESAAGRGRWGKKGGVEASQNGLPREGRCGARTETNTPLNLKSKYWCRIKPVFSISPNY